MSDHQNFICGLIEEEKKEQKFWFVNCNSLTLFRNYVEKCWRLDLVLKLLNHPNHHKQDRNFFQKKQKWKYWSFFHIIPTEPRSGGGGIERVLEKLIKKKIQRTGRDHPPTAGIKILIIFENNDFYFCFFLLISFKMFGENCFKNPYQNHTPHPRFKFCFFFRFLWKYWF